MPTTTTFSHSLTRGTVRFQSLSSKNDDHDNRSSPTIPVLERLQVSGVSVSPKGFHMLLQKSSTSSQDACYIPIKVTNDIQDAVAATSPESLTLCQLLSGVDMAGAILPPELLSKLVVYHVEQKKQDNGSLLPVEQKILEEIHQSLSKFEQAGDTYKDAHEWFQSRIRLPQVTLDQLTLIPSQDDDDDNNNKLQWKCRLECALPEQKEKIVLPSVQTDLLSSLAFHFDPDTSLMFTCLALALRYKAPIVLEVPSETRSEVEVHPYTKRLLTADQLDAQFPQRTTVGKLQQQSTRVTENIERGFEIHKLQGALSIAMKMGDKQAVEKIRAKLDEYDSMQDLPTTTETTTKADQDSDDDTDDEGSLDDLDKNILQ